MHHAETPEAAHRPRLAVWRGPDGARPASVPRFTESNGVAYMAGSAPDLGHRMALSAAGKRAGSTERARWKCGRSAIRPDGVSTNCAAWLIGLDFSVPPLKAGRYRCAGNWESAIERTGWPFQPRQAAPG